MLGAHLLILAHIYDELSHKQAEFPTILSQMAKNDFEGHRQWAPFSIPAESIRKCMFGAHLVILAQIYDDLLHGQAEFPRIRSQNGQNDLEGEGQWPPFLIPAESIPGCMFGANLMVLAQIHDELSRRQAEFWVKMAKMTLKAKVNDPYFQYQPWVFHDACLVQIWWFQLKSVTRYRADKVKFTDRGTDGRTDGRADGQTQVTIPLRPERSRDNKTIFTVMALLSISWALVMHIWVSDMCQHWLR